MTKRSQGLIVGVAFILAIGLAACSENKVNIKSDTATKAEEAKTEEATKSEVSDKAVGETEKEDKGKNKEEKKEATAETKKETKEEAKKETPTKDQKKEEKPATPAKPKTTGAKDKKESDKRESEGVEVVEIKLAEKVENRQPVGEKTTFDTGDKVYAWINLKVKELETEIKMRWSLGDQVMFTSDPIKVKKSPKWRTWLYKTVKKAGDWKIDILDIDGKPIYAEKFTVK